MILSRGCEYAIRASIYVAAHDEEGFVPIHVIGSELGVSGHFLTKILQQLTQAGIMKSHRGPSGGVSLARPASKIALHEIVVAIDGAALFSECLLGLPSCSDGNPCPLHEKWSRTRGQLTNTFRSTSLESLAQMVRKDALRLSAH